MGGTNTSSSQGSSQGTSNFASNPSNFQNPWFQSLQVPVGTGISNALTNAYPGAGFATANGSLSPFNSPVNGNPWYGDTANNPLVAPLTSGQNNALAYVNNFSPGTQYGYSGAGAPQAAYGSANNVGYASGQFGN